jgi:hypothetical protein
MARTKFFGGRRRALTLGTIGAVVVTGVTLGAIVATASPTYVDLTTADANQNVNGAIFIQGTGPAGTGQFDPFLTIQTNDNTEQGHNTCPPELDTACIGNARTHALSAAAIPPKTIGGIKYREFSLDANDQGSDDYMSIDDFKVFLDDQNNLTGFNNTANTFSNDTGTAASLAYTLPSGTIVLMRSQTLSPGSGVSDISVEVPDSIFPANCSYGSTTCTTWVTLFTHMGGAGTINVGNGCASGCDYNVTGGFEEWRTELLPVVNVAKTAVPSFTRTFPWTVKKSVSVDGGTTYQDVSADLNLFNGDSANVKWKIEYTKGTPVDSNQKLTGSVTVKNPTGPGGVITTPIDATVSSVSDVLSQLGQSDSSVSLTCPVTFPVTLTAGQQFVCTYTKNLPSSATGTNTATATLSGGQTYSDQVPFDPTTATPTLVDATAGLDDNLDPNLPTTVTGTDSITYDTSQACGSSRSIVNTAVLTTTDTKTVLTDPATLNITCVGLTTTKDAHPSFGRNFDWSVKKYVSTDGQTYVDDSVTIHQFLGDVSTIYWRIIPTRDAGHDGSFAVTGTIVVHNDTSLDASNVSVSDSIAGVGAAAVDCDPITAGNQTTVNVAHSSTASCTYSATLPDNATRLNTATATLFGVNYTGTASINFTGVNPTTTDATASLDDTFDAGLPAAASSGVAVEYTTTANCGSSRTITNTATVTETDSQRQTSDPAAANIDCQSLTVTKTATPTFNRAWTWHVLKNSQDTTLNLELGQTFFEPYSVTYSATKLDSAFNVSGTITVTSPANAPSRQVDVSDVYAATNAAVDCNGATAGSGLPATLSGGGTLNCTYSLDLAAATNGNNVATATVHNVPSGTTNFTSSAVPVTFGSTPAVETDETVNVTDTVPAGSYCTGLNTPVTGCTLALAGTGPPAGSISAAQAPKTFTYTRIIGPYGTGECGDHLIDNTASFTTTDTAATGSSSVEITVHIPCPTGCTLTQGYWKTHSIKGPAPFDDNWNNIPTDPYAPGAIPGSAENTVFFYSGQTWYQAFWTPPSGGNAYYQLAHQYEAAVLNMLNGADSSAVTATLNSALALLSNPANTPTSIGKLKGNDPLRAQFISLAGILGSYNTGLIGPGHCSEDKTTSPAP